jgi:tRNA modification GTPase
LAKPQAASRATIFALSSGAPPAGVAIVRVSGPKVREILERMAGGVPEPRRAVLRAVTHPSTGEVLDQALVLFFPAPASFTGEDVAEFHLHGGRAVVAAVIAALGVLDGLRLAEPGEFTRRAFDAGQLDLAEAEGLADLVQAETEMQRRQALSQAGGALSQVYEGWRARLIRARAMIEAELDFADEDDVPKDISAAAFAEINIVSAEIKRGLARAAATERLRDGVQIVLLGAPNSGKSTLLNTLAGRDVAIVAEEPGTTRDLLEVKLDLYGYPAMIVDTAGVRESESRVEREGIRRAQERAATADIIVLLTDATDQASALPAPANREVLRVFTKADLIDSQAERDSIHGRSGGLLVSAQSGLGMDELVADLTERVALRLGHGETAVVTRARHRIALEDCVEALREAMKVQAGGPELVAEELRRASDALGRVTGRVDVEDVLGAIFGEFCIGK